MTLSSGNGYSASIARRVSFPGAGGTGGLVTAGTFADRIRIHMSTALPNFSPTVASFMRQIADDPFAAGDLSFTHAASVILPATGWPGEAFTDLLWRELSLPRNALVLQQAVRKQAEGMPLSFSFSLASRRGGRAHFLASPRPITAPDGSKILVMALAPHPATAPVFPAGGCEEAVLNLLNAFPVYVLLIGQDHIIKFSNRVARQFFGNVDGKLCHEALYGLDAPCGNCTPFALFGDGTIKVHEWVCAKKNTAFRAHSYPFETADGTRHILQVGINITAGIRARHALDLSEQRYRSIAENLTMGLALVDPALTVITVNPKMEEWFGPGLVKGTSIEQVLGNACCNDAQAGPESEDGCVFRAVLKTKENKEREFRLTTPTGEERFFRLVACPILSRGRQIRAMVIMLEDITDRLTMAERLQQIQRLEALGSLAAGIAHEINQPLSALHLYASGMQMLLEQGTRTSPERIMERLSLILTQADKIRQIISHMRALVLQEGHSCLESVSVHKAVTDALGLVGVQLHDHGIKIFLDMPENAPLARASAVQLEQVAINLLINAMHALDSLEKPDKSIHVGLSLENEFTLALRVTDNGPGVGALHSRIFDPFFTTKSQADGMGLGLSIVHAFVSSWGGGVKAENNAEGGATFTVTIPVAQPGALPAETEGAI